jgi:hypothetical protein
MGHASVVRKVRGAAMPQPKELNHGFLSAVKNSRMGIFLKMKNSFT